MDKNSSIRQILVAVIISTGILWLVIPLKADYLPEEAMSITISCSRQNCLVAEPLVLSLAFKNSSVSNQLLDTHLGNGIGMVEYLISKDDSHFERISPLISVEPGRRSDVVIASGESFCHEEVLAFDTRTHGALFSEPGDYFIRVNYLGRKSNTLKIHVKIPDTPEDKQWVEDMKSSNVAMTLTFPTWKTEDAIKVLKECAGGSSVYSHYAVFTLASIESNITNALALYEKADVAEFPLQSRAVFERAQIYLKLDEIQKAHELLQRVVNGFPSSAAACEVKIKHLLESSLVKTSPPSPEDVLAEAIKSLESEWYDVKGYWRDMNLPGAREYAQKRNDLYELQLTGKITEAERARQEAELLKTYIHKYCQPLPPAEWKRLNDGYAKEQADRQAQQVQEMKNHVVENERLLRASKTNTVPKGQ